MLKPEPSHCDHCDAEHPVFQIGVYSWYCDRESPHPFMRWSCAIECGTQGEIFWDGDGYCDEFPGAVCFKCGAELGYESLEFLSEN